MPFFTSEAHWEFERCNYSEFLQEQFKTRESLMDQVATWHIIEGRAITLVVMSADMLLGFE